MANRNLNVVLSATDANLSSTLRKSAAEVTTFSSTVNGANASVVSSTDMIGKGFLIAGAAVAAGLAMGIQAAIQFEAAMRNVTTISSFVANNFGEVSSKIRDLSTTLPQSAKVLAEGLYEVASSGFAGREGLQVLETSAKAASAGLTDTGTSAKAITAVLNAYGMEASKAGKVSDILFQTVNLGVVTFEELAHEIGGVLGMASVAGVEFEEVGSAIATITLAGIPAAEAVTSLNRVIQSIVDPSESMGNALRAIGFESGQAAIEAVGLQGVMERLKGIAGDNVASWQALFPEIRALRGALALTAAEGENWQRVAKGIDEATRGIGATQRALAQQSQSFAFQWKIVVNQLMDFGIQVGTAVLPVLKVLGSILGTIAGGLSALPGPVKTALVSFLLLAGALRLATPLLERFFLQAALGSAQVGVGQTALRGMHTAATGLSKSLPMAATGALIAASGFQAIGSSTESAVVGIGSMIAGGAILGSAILPGWGTAIGAVAGGTIGLAKALFDSGESMEDYADKVRNLGAQLENLGTADALKKFLDVLKNSPVDVRLDDGMVKLSGNIRNVTNELNTLAKVSPQAALKVVEGLRRMKDESGKPLFNKAEIELATAAVLRGAEAHDRLAERSKNRQAVQAALARGDIDGAMALANYASEAERAAAAIENVHDATIKMLGGQLGLQQAIWDAEDAEAAYVKAVQEHGIFSREAAEADIERQKAALDLAAASDILGQSQDALITRFRNNPADLEAEIKKFQDLKEAAPGAAGAIDPILQKLIDLKTYLDGLPKEPATVSVNETGMDETKNKAKDVKGAVDEIPPEKSVFASETGFGGVIQKAFDTAGAVNAIPPEKIVFASEQGMGGVIQKAFDTAAAVVAIPKDREVIVRESYMWQVTQKALEVRDAVYAIPLNWNVTLSVTDLATSALNRVQGLLSVVENRISAGIAGVRDEADGGIIRYFASGSERHVAQIAPAGTWRVWAEPETGGEAYIPLAASKRARSTQILGNVAGQFGYSLAPVRSFATGGLLEQFKAAAQQYDDRTFAKIGVAKERLDYVTNVRNYAAGVLGEGSAELAEIDAGLQRVTGELNRAVSEYADSTDAAKRTHEELVATFKDSPDALQAEITRLRELRDSTAGAAAALDPLIAKLTGVSIAAGHTTQADVDLEAKLTTIGARMGYIHGLYEGAVRDFGLYSQEALDAEAALTREMGAAADAIGAYVTASEIASSSQEVLVKKFEEAPEALDAQIARLEVLKEATGAAGAAFDPLLDKLRKVKAEITPEGGEKGEAGLPSLEQQKQAIIDTTELLKKQIESVPKKLNVQISVTDFATPQLAYIREITSTPIVQEIHLRVKSNGAIIPGQSALPFADGSERHVAQIAPAGAWRLWAEPETGGEAYIPLAASKRARSTRILGAVADEFGFGLVPNRGVKHYAHGGTSAVMRGHGGISVRTTLVVEGNIYGDAALKKTIKTEIDKRDDALATTLSMNRG